MGCSNGPEAYEVDPSSGQWCDTWRPGSTEEGLTARWEAKGRGVDLEKPVGRRAFRTKGSSKLTQHAEQSKGKEKVEPVFDFTSILLLQQDEAGGSHQIWLDTVKQGHI